MKTHDIQQKNSVGLFLLLLVVQCFYEPYLIIAWDRINTSLAIGSNVSENYGTVSNNFFPSKDTNVLHISHTLSSTDFHKEQGGMSLVQLLYCPQLANARSHRTFCRHREYSPADCRIWTASRTASQVTPRLCCSPSIYSSISLILQDG